MQYKIRVRVFPRARRGSISYLSDFSRGLTGFALLHSASLLLSSKLYGYRNRRDEHTECSTILLLIIQSTVQGLGCPIAQFSEKISQANLTSRLTPIPSASLRFTISPLVPTR
jgi:hypothetical protein